MLLGVSAAVIILLLLMICIHAHFIRRIEAFGVNAGYYLSGDGGWAGQMQPAAVSVDGSTGLVPTPKAGQQNSYLRGDGKWIQANNAPSAIAYMLVCRTSTSNIDNGTAVTFQKVVNESGNLISLSTDGAKFTLVPGYTYKLTSCNNYPSRSGGGSNPYQWYNNNAAQYIGISGNFQVMPGQYFCQGPAVAIISPASLTTVSVYGVMPSGFNNINSTADVIGSVAAIGYLLGFWASVEAISNTTVAAFGGATASADGFTGYIPAPKSGQQNYVLTGSGGWSPGGPAFSAYLGRAQTVPNGPVTIVQYDTVEFDTAKCFNTSTYAYMPNVAGYYQVNALVYYSSNSTTGMFQIFLLKNGAGHKRGPSIYNATNNQNVGISFSSIVAMNGTTDYIQIAVVASAGAPQVILNSSDLTWFNSAMVRPL